VSPAAVFRKVATHVRSHCRLGLTATLVRVRGSGWVAVGIGSLDRQWQCGHFGTKHSVAVAGWQWQWAHWIGSGSAVILIPNTAWQWQWLGGSGDRLIGSAVAVRSFWYQTRCGCGWQWLGGSGFIGLAVAVRSFWYQTWRGCGSGWVAVGIGALDRQWQCGHFGTKHSVAVAGSGWVAVGSLDRQWQCGHFGTRHGVAVANSGWVAVEGGWVAVAGLVTVRI
jgi:hypothetical protein